MTMTDKAASVRELPDGTRTLQVWWEPPLGALRILGMSREEQLAALVSGSLPKAPITQLLNFDVAEADPGRIVVELNPDERHLSPVGSVHGGVIAAILDSAMWCAAQTSLDDKSILATVNMNIGFTRTVAAGCGLLRAVAGTLHVGRTSVTAEARLIDAADTLYAHATASFLRSPSRAAS
ncbi:PaaI family thioesterase [Nocardia sp. NPDC003345]